MFFSFEVVTGCNYFTRHLFEMASKFLFMVRCHDEGNFAVFLNLSIYI